MAYLCYNGQMDLNKDKAWRPKRPLLQTKLFMPRSRAHLVTRARLLHKLNRAILPDCTIETRLTLVTGPAGYGKSTLITQWLTQLTHEAAWLSLDESDNDEARFLAYLFAALATVQPAIGNAALSRLGTSYLFDDCEAILTTVLNDLASETETAVLVLDDYHLIHLDAIHKAITFILQHAPPQLHLVIASRTDPPLPLSNLRVQNALTWINQQDLQFTSQEATDYLKSCMNLTLTPSQIELLDQQVEGWVTGLQLIGLALKEAITLPEAISGNQRYLVDYLAEQVLNNQPPDIQQFLLKTAVLNRFCAPLCDSIFHAEKEAPPARATLRRLESANLFLIPLDAERHWYRYHHLFSDFLNGRLQNRASPEQIADIHRCAAHWLYQNGYALTAVEHALHCHAYALAAEIIREVGQEVLMFGEGITLRHWLEQLPAALFKTDPQLTLFYIWALIRTGDLPKAKLLLNDVSDQLDTPLLWGEWSALRARIAVITGDTDLNIRFSNKALSKLPLDQHMLRSEVAINLGFSHLQQANIEEARQAFAEAAQQTAHDPGLWAVMFATFYWGTTFERDLRLNDAFQVYQNGLVHGEARASDSPALGFMHVGLGQIYYDRNQLAEAESHLRQAVRCAERSGDHKMTIYSLEGLAQLWVALGDWAEAQSCLDQLEREIGVDGISTRRAILSLQVGEMDTAVQWISQLDLHATDDPEQIAALPVAYLTLSRYLLAQNRSVEAIPILQTLTEFAQRRKSQQFLVRVLLLHALALGKQGAVETAVPIYQRALALAGPAGLVRPFLNLTDPTHTRMLHLCAQSGVIAEFARRLLVLHSADAKEGVAETAVVPLTPRELELLQHLAKGLTNRQIGEQMTITLNTVKAHTRRLYAKLDAHNRTEAVAKARTANLL